MFSTLGHDFITLHYQPLTVPDGTVAGMEALMRWHHRQRGSISPEAFIPIFEKSGLIVPLSRWALGEACAEAAQWSQPLLVAVNLSAIQFVQDDLLFVVRTALAESELPPSRLELEVTDAALVSDAAYTANVMSNLRGEGVKIALADFGSQRSSLSHLKDFPFSKIKIARELVARLETSAPARSIVGMIIDFAHSRNLSVAAEGIETPGQFAFLEANGCDWFQGYLIGRPAPIEAHMRFTGAGTVGAGSAPGKSSDAFRGPTTPAARHPATDIPVPQR